MIGSYLRVVLLGAMVMLALVLAIDLLDAPPAEAPSVTTSTGPGSDGSTTSAVAAATADHSARGRT